MAVLAIDIGTTTICALVMDEESGAVIETRSEANTFLPAVHSWGRSQSPDLIFSIVEELVLSLIKKYRTFRCIGISGQMHGIVYLDSSGRAVSPLYTWQDSSASQKMNNRETYAEHLKKFSPDPIAPGYGLATCFYHLSSGAVPAGAVKICTIGDYAAMRLCNSSLPVMHTTNAGGMGFFDLRSSSFDARSLELAGIDPSLLPRVVSAGEVLGEFSGSIPVCVSIGDNQASFIGSVKDAEESVLVNIGTGSQISLLSRSIEKPEFMELRPFFEDSFLLVGAPLCGGRAYTILESFFRQVLVMAGFNGDSAIRHDASLYDAMDAAANAVSQERGERQSSESPLTVHTFFAGSRSDPSVRGSIQNISEDNFTPANLVVGFLNGIARELYDLYLPVKKKGAVYKKLIGGGNGIRKNRPLKRILSEKFEMPLEIPIYQEEAAYGAALFALTCTGYFKNIFQAQQFVSYED